VEFDHPEEGHREYEVHTFETFAKGIGLIHYRKQIVDGPTIEYELVDRFPMTELEKRYLQQWWKIYESGPALFGKTAFLLFFHAVFQGFFVLFRFCNIEGGFVTNVR